MLAPHFSGFSVGQYHERARAAAEAGGRTFAGVEHWFDLDAFVEWRAFGDGARETGYLVLAYRQLDLFAEYDDVDSGVVADLALRAWTLGLRFRF